MRSGRKRQHGSSGPRTVRDVAVFLDSFSAPFRQVGELVVQCPQRIADRVEIANDHEHLKRKIAGNWFHHNVKIARS